MRRIVVAAAMLAAILTAGWVAGIRRETFPHSLHEGLFPLCESCHSGIFGGVAADRFPSPEVCTACHDGVVRARVEWTGPTRRISNLRYDHVTHLAQVRAAGDSLTCHTCHGTEPGVRMAVGGPRPESCLECHAHEAPSHLSAGRDCSICHVTLAQATALSADRIAAFPKPPSHDEPGFLSGHAPRTPNDETACATCHAQETCARCHVNAAAVPAIAALQPDPRVAANARGRAPAYPTPASHTAGDWIAQHGGDVTTATASCANCHTRSSCETCHRDGATAAIAALPAAAPDDPRGVRLAALERVHPTGFATSHAIDGAARESTCESCHARTFCENCHAGPRTPGFHGPAFLARHAPEAYGNEQDCASCHNAEVFCRACHSGLGLAAVGRNAIGFHTSNPAWVLGHGQAARQGMDGCITCHTQASCLQCHSARSGWRINPHGPDFDAIRMRNANQLMCRRCHLAGAIFR
jgi:hypothetical protein